MIPTYKPSINRKDMDAVLTCMVEENFTHGDISRDYLKRFGKELNQYNLFGFRESQRAFETLLDAFEVAEGTRIALSPLSPWWYHVILKKRGIIPVYIDIDPDRCVLNKEALENVDELADFIFIYHNLGYENDLHQFEEMSIPVFEDITEVLASRLGGNESFSGHAGVFSLNEEGYVAGLGSSFIFTRDKKESLRIKNMMKNIQPALLLSDIQSAIGISQLARLEKYSNRRNELYTIFLNSLLKSKNRTFMVEEDAGYIPYSFPVILNTGSKEIFQYAKKKKILCKSAFENTIVAHFPDEVEKCPGAKSLLLRCILFPLYPSLSGNDVNMIAKILSSLP